ncbi:unnamed protein product [Bemisia tabaci]|uniref:Endoplasmic reticulum lectin 1 n=1 Tax=Bemisia tabaci TaxID=7038 RepID=A0A9P0AH63_BEMTA|nr:unnamed protein product [Bemisia tabaci]
MKFLSILFISFCYGSASDLEAFDDTILFKINWPRGDEKLLNLEEENREVLPISTKLNEAYQCVLPNIKEKDANSQEVYNGPNPLDLLSPLFTQTGCSYRLDSYWTYELCHGKFLRQYHEDRDGKQIKLQEYFLGRWTKVQMEKLRMELDSKKDIPPSRFKKIEGINLPYLEMNMTDGTMCDLTGRPRHTSVLYVCYNHGKHDFYSLKEVSSCHYEVIIISSLLCLHPHYKPKETGENSIDCIPKDPAGKKPLRLLQLEAESLMLRHKNLLDDDFTPSQKIYTVVSVLDNEGGGQDDEPSLLIQIRPMPQSTPQQIQSQPTSEGNKLSKPVMESGFTPIVTGPSLDPLVAFLNGINCLQGGSGWWKFEFCYMERADQYHIDSVDGSRTTVRLGTWNLKDHLDWIERNPHKKPKPIDSRTYVSHFYSQGSICEKTGQPREVEVKLKCIQGGPSKVSLYLLEPDTCKYILGVEASIICRLLPHADENGLFQLPQDETQDIDLTSL